MTDEAAQMPGAENRSQPRRNASEVGTKRRWVFAMVVTFAVHAAAFWLFAVSSLPVARKHPPGPQLVWSGSSSTARESALGEQLTLLDPAPLFLPTQWNVAGREGGVQQQRSPLEIFDPYPERLSVAADRRPEMLRVFPAVENDAARYVSAFPWPALAAFGRSDVRVAGSAAARVARLEVRSMAGGALAFTREILGTDIPPGTAWPEWQPMEALIVVEPVGTLGTPLLVRSSGSEIVDAFFRDQIIARLRASLLLPAGYYRVVVGP